MGISDAHPSTTGDVAAEQLVRLVDDYLAAWNETDATARLELLQRCLSADAVYRDPTVAVRGRPDLARHIAGVQSRRPGARLELVGAVEHHHRVARFDWRLVGADGTRGRVSTDVVDVGTTGLITSVTGFFGQQVRRPPPDPRRPPTLDEARAVLGAQPFSTLIGASLLDFGDGGATLEVPLRPELLQQDHVVHGGLLAYAADNAMSFAGGSVLGAHVLTAAVSIHYVAPARGDLLRAHARAEDLDGRQAASRCTITVRRRGEWTVCAVAHGSVKAVRNPPRAP